MKIKLTEQEIKAVKESIEYWDNDIINNFRKGRIINVYSLTWNIAGSSNIKVYAEDCPLCKLAKNAASVGKSKMQ